ncbi:hypothetical protein Tco_0982563, partial [Tanacetum coccineum]
NETVRSELRMAVVQQSMEMDMWEIKEKLAERREQMAIRAYEEDKRHEELNQKIEEDKRREELNQKIEELKNLIQSFIRNPISPPVATKVPTKPIQNSPCYDDLTYDRNKKTTEKGVGKEGFGCALNKSKGSHLGLRHCVANRKRKKRKGPFVWTKSKSRVVIEVGQTEAIEGWLNCDNRSPANYEQPCQHLLMFDYDPQEGELQVKTWDPGITWLKILKEHLEDKVFLRGELCFEEMNVGSIYYHTLCRVLLLATSLSGLTCLLSSMKKVVYHVSTARNEAHLVTCFLSFFGRSMVSSE